MTAVPWLEGHKILESLFHSFSEPIHSPVTTRYDHRVRTLRVGQIEHTCGCSNIGRTGVLREEVVCQSGIVWRPHSLASNCAGTKGSLEVRTHLGTNDSTLPVSI